MQINTGKFGKWFPGNYFSGNKHGLIESVDSMGHWPKYKG
jgi:hypothetical protein